jgi:hypothetical protein
MLDLSHIPNSQQDVKIFYSISGSNSWQTWQKPRKCNYVWIMCIGGGGGGAGVVYSGNLSGSVITTAGTCGGGSGAVTRVLYNSQLINDVLYVQVGRGGNGGNPNSTTTLVSGVAGTRSFVSLQPSTVAQNLVCCSGTAGAGGGLYAAGGAGETAATQTAATFLTLGNFTSIAGQAGALAGANITPLTSQITSGGAGGGGLNSSVPASGGNINSSSISNIIQGSPGNPTTIAGCGITSFKPFFSLGGAGGGAGFFTNIQGGGDGGIGSGGGGSGALQNGGSSFTGSIGGRGGDGLVVIISF